MPNWVVNNITMTGSQESIAAVIDLLRSKDKDAAETIDFNNVIKMPESMNLVCGGSDREYVALYLRSLNEKERTDIANKLRGAGCSFYRNYLSKYAESFRMDVSPANVRAMKNSFREAYASINPKSVEDVGRTYIENILNYGADTWYDWSCKNWGTKWGPDNFSLIQDGFQFDTAWSASLPITQKLSEMFPNVIFSHEYADENIGSNCGRFVFEKGEMIDVYLPEGTEAVRFACDIWEEDASDYLERRGEEEVVEVSPLADQIALCSAQVNDRDSKADDINREVR